MNATLRFDRGAGPRFLLAAALFATALGAYADAALRTVQIKVAGHPLKVEVAQSDAEREKGLMHRKSLGRDDGMVFVFDEPGYHAMWMKNTLIPLSVAFVDREGTILSIHDMEPQTLTTHQSAGPSIYAVETNKGWFAQKKVKVGDKVTGLPKK
jgi:uncharacterized membrane protein (UPF0127 family)